MKVLFAATECAPFFKTGGLGDVLGSLPNYLGSLGVDVRVVLPFYHGMKKEYQDSLVDLTTFNVDVGYRKQYCGVKALKLNQVQYYFLDNMYYFNRPDLYGYYDDGERFAYFSQAVCEMILHLQLKPDLVHLHDYHVAMIPFLFKEKFADLKEIKTILTIHNLEFQGKMSGEQLADFFGVSNERYLDGTLRWEDQLNFMKSGILYADYVTTVSPSYAEEIRTPEFGEGLDQVLRMEEQKLCGILNGIDLKLYDPAHDQRIVANYSSGVSENKKLNKIALQEELGLPVNDQIPLIGVVSRLTYQKGVHLILDELNNLGQFDLQFVLIGTGLPQFEAGLSEISNYYPHKMRVIINFDSDLAQRIYAGSDFFLMPSAFEPCGLSQMIAMRYGSLPIVHEVGGLIDTVTPYNQETGTGDGFGFRDFSGYQMMEAIKKAVTLYHENPQALQKMINQAMQTDFGWGKSAHQYLDLYHQLLGKTNDHSIDHTDVEEENIEEVD